MRGFRSYSRNSDSGIYTSDLGQVLSPVTTEVPSASPQAAFGHEPTGGFDASSQEDGFSPVEGSQPSRSPSQRATGVLTAFPTRRQRGLLRRFGSSMEGSVQSAGRPCSRSASRMSGVPISSVAEFQIPGGEGIPTAEPPFSVGTASTAHPSPRSP